MTTGPRAMRGGPHTTTAQRAMGGRAAHDHRATGDAGRAAHDLRIAGDGPGAAAGRPGVRGGGISASRRGPGRGERLPATLALGSDPAGVTPATEVAELVRAAHDLPGTVRERLGEAYGVKVADAVGRLQDSRITSALRTALEKAPQGQTAPVVPWLANLASALLEDAGAQTRDGVRTARARLEAGQRPEDPHRAIEVESGAFGYLAPCGLIEQIRLGFAYAHDAWAGLAALRNTGREGEWALNEADSESNQLAGDERETLEAARDIGLALGRIERARAAAHDGGPPSALEQAEMAAQTLRAVGPTVRTAAGWPGAAPPPNARSPGGRRADCHGRGGPARGDSRHRQPPHRRLGRGGPGPWREPPWREPECIVARNDRPARIAAHVLAARGGPPWERGHLARLNTRVGLRSTCGRMTCLRPAPRLRPGRDELRSTCGRMTTLFSAEG